MNNYQESINETIGTANLSRCGMPRRPLSILLSLLPSFKYEEIPKHCLVGLKCECPICLSRFGLNSTVRRFPCGHIFHKECIDKWIEACALRTCPSCNRDIDDMTTAHLMYKNADVGGATRQQIIGYENAEFGVEFNDNNKNPSCTTATNIQPSKNSFIAP